NLVLQALAVALRDLLRRHQNADHRRHAAASVIHRVDDGGDAVAEEGFADDIPAGFVLLHHLPQAFTVVKLPRRVARQTLMREQLFEISAGNIGQQHAAERGAVHRQTGTNTDLVDARPGGADAGDVYNV